MRGNRRACRTALGVVSIAGALLGAANGCGGGDDAPGQTEPKDTSAPDDTTIDSTVSDTADSTIPVDDTDLDVAIEGGDAGGDGDASADLGVDTCPPVSSDAKDPETGSPTSCGTSCPVDLSNDGAHCGRCDKACAAGQACVTGICDDVATALSGLRWELPCVVDDPGDSLCVSTAPVTITGTLTGTPGITYDVRLRFRGVVELETYTGGTNDGAYFQIGGAPSTDGWNVYRMDVTEPASTYFLNRGIGGKYFCVGVDYTKTIKMKAGATVSLLADPVDDGMYEIKNLDEAGVAIVVPGVSPAPAPFHGQFIQMDVVSVAPAP